MGAVTYQEPAVADLVNQRFVPVQVNTQDGTSAKLIKRFRQVWTPDIRVLGPDGFDYYHWNGYLPPSEFLPQLLVGQAMAYLRQEQDEQAAHLYEEALRRFPTSAVAPEAQYYLAVSKYRRSHEASDLLGGWHKVQSRYPQTIWRAKQSFIER